MQNIHLQTYVMKCKIHCQTFAKCHWVWNLIFKKKMNFLKAWKPATFKATLEFKLFYLLNYFFSIPFHLLASFQKCWYKSSFKPWCKTFAVKILQTIRNLFVFICENVGISLNNMAVCICRECRWCMPGWLTVVIVCRMTFSCTHCC